MDFENYGLSKEILKSIKLLGYKKPSKVQEKSIPLILKNNDLIVKSKTGSGKTAAFSIPLCEKVIWEENSPQALILSPTRELCVQIKDDVSNIGKFKRIKAVSVFGKQPFSIQSRELKQKTHIVVGTPGRTLDHIERGTLKTDKVKYLVIDEADEMLNMGFIDQVESIIKKLPKDRVTMMFSATIPEEIELLCTKYMKNLKRVNIESEGINSLKITHRYFKVEDKDKLELLNKLLIVHNPETCMMFCRTKDNVEKVYNYLCSKKYPCMKIHGGMMQDERLKVMDDFKRGKVPYLVATDVASRGIDVEDVTEVINVDLPMEKESYVHRIGRTGRAGREGRAVTFVTPYEDKFFKDIEQYIGFEIQEAENISDEEVLSCKDSFEKRLKSKPNEKHIKQNAVSQGIMKIYMNGGRKKKIRPGDIVGAICSIPGLTGEDIGIIDVQDNVSYVEILNNKGNIALEGLKKGTIKGKKLKVEIAK